MNKEGQQHRPVIETLINTSAIALSAFGVTTITNITPFPIYQGYLALAVAMGLEYFKYWGRLRNIW